MIKLTRLNNSEFYLNPHLIERIEETPDTIITLVNDNHYVVTEKAKAVVAAIVAYRVHIAHDPIRPSDSGGTPPPNRD